MAETEIEPEPTLSAPPQSEPIAIEPAESLEAPPTESLEAPPAEPLEAPPKESLDEPSTEVDDRKRKHDELEGGEALTEAPATDAVEEEANGVVASEAVMEQKVEGGVEAVVEADGGQGEPKRQRLDGETDELAIFNMNGEQQAQVTDAPAVANGEFALEGKNGEPQADETENPTAHQEEIASSVDPRLVADPTPISRKIEIPNGRVGVLIGKAGETIRNLQHNTGAKIQIQRDADTDPNSGFRYVELIGIADSVNKAEQLIKEVMAEADAGGSPALIARGFGSLHSGLEQLELKIPNEKVGMIIGKGGETIKNLQSRSGARIQLIPQHLPDGDIAKERVVRISGNKKQIEAATDMIKEVMSQGPGRPSSFSRSQHAYRPHGPASSPQWGARPPMQQGTGYDYQHRGPYQSQAPHYSQSYAGGYAQQQQHHQQPRANYGTGWEQRPAQTPPQAGYNYYGQAQGGPPVDVQQSGPPMNNTSGVGGPAPASGNYYGQPQNSGYGQPSQYPQPMATQASYGQGYSEPRYDAQAPTQQVYGQPPVNTQPAQYAQGAPVSYQQQAYNRPVYPAPPAQSQPQAYGPPAGNPSDPAYQVQYQAQNPQNYGQQQQYPYGSAVPQAYGGTPGTQDGYMQQPSSGYSQYGAPAPVYAQPGQAPVYQQGGQASYPQYSQPQQQVYSEQPAQANAVYGYQGTPASTGYGAPTTAYVAPTAAAGYAQAPANPTTGYDQTAVAQQPSYVGPPPAAGAQAAYTKSLSPQPQAQPQQQTGYVQYDSTQQNQVYNIT